jgi:hypothetical protein
VWSRNSARRIGGNLALEFWAPKSGLKCGHALPDGVVQEGRAIAYSTMQLCRYEPTLALHEFGIPSPSFYQAISLALVYREDIDQNDWRIVLTELIDDADAVV